MMSIDEIQGLIQQVKDAAEQVLVAATAAKDACEGNQTEEAGAGHIGVAGHYGLARDALEQAAQMSQEISQQAEEAGNNVAQAAGLPTGASSSTGPRGEPVSLAPSSAGGSSSSWKSFSHYVASLETQTPRGTPGSPEQQYQLRHAGDTEYRIAGRDSQIWADSVHGIDVATGEAVDTKYIGNLSRSPYIPGTACPDFIREKVDKQQRHEFERYAAVVESDANPLTGLHVITNDHGAAGYFAGLMKEFNIPGRISVKE